MDYALLREFAMRPRAQEETVSYLTEKLSHFVRRMDSVLICLPNQEPGSLSHLMEQAVLLCEGVPVTWGQDHRWVSLLRLAFSSRVSAIVSTPLIALGLSKLQNYYSIPLFVRDVVTAGYPCEEWMIEGLCRGFDCHPRGCLSVGTTGIVAGFSCEKHHGVHIRDDLYQVEIVDEKGVPVPEGEAGEMVISWKGRPETRYAMGENARLFTGRCQCGSYAPLLMDIVPGRTEADADLRKLGNALQSWNSVLDCRIGRSPHGLELELITLPGGRLPELPTVAKQVIRPLNPETDAPFFYDPTQKIRKNPETAIDF